MAKKMSFTRRAFLVGGSVVGAGTIIGLGFLSTVNTTGLEAAVREDGTVQLTAWVEFRPNGEIVFNVPRTEMGQGTSTGMPMLMAEELELDLSDPKVRVEFPDAALPAYTNFTLALQSRPEDQKGPFAWATRKVFSLVGPIVTGGSTSIIDAYVPLRKAGAAARIMFERAAAAEWGISPDAVVAQNGMVRERGGDRRLSYGELAPKAAEQKPPNDPPLKPRSDWQQIGKPVQRLDIPAKTRGAAAFGIDTLPQEGDEILTATVVHAPQFGSTTDSFDATEALKVKGVRGVHDIGTGIAVVADTYYAASKAASLVTASWTKPATAPSTADIEKELARSLTEDKPTKSFEQGDAMASLRERTDLDVIYETPYLAHATLEPMNTTACITPEKAELWAPTQAPLFVRQAAGNSIQKPKEVIVHTTLAGGGFGRRSEMDIASEAVKVADLYPGIMVKTVWSREEDTAHDFYRPAARARMRARLDEDGLPEAIDYRIAVQSLGDGFAKRNQLPISQGGPGEPSKTEGADDDFPYAVPNRICGSTHVEFPVPVGYWRSVGHTNNGFFVESMMDELALAAKADPFDYRQKLVSGHERWDPLAKELRAKSGWDTPLATDMGVLRGRGVALCESFKSFVGMVAEVSVRDGEVRVDRVTAVADVGIYVNPDSVKAQMEGSVFYALTALLHGKVTLENGAVQEGNFDSYPIVQLSAAPSISVSLMENAHKPGGAGEPGTPPTFAAVTNAIFAATGIRVRKLPITESQLVAAV